jgi:hypothetical protein
MQAVHSLNKVLKELSTKRMVKDMKAYASIAHELFPVVKHCWSQCTQNVIEEMQKFSSNSGERVEAQLSFLTELVELNYYTTKVIYRLVLFG